MGRVYCGAYADQVGYEHEGYGARLLPGGELTAAWTVATAEFTAYVAACGCGWSGGRFAPTDDGEEAALAAWDREHLQLLIANAAREGWRIWGSSAAGSASEIAAYMGAGRVELAVPVMKRLVQNVQTWARILDEVAEERAAADGGGR